MRFFGGWFPFIGFRTFVLTKEGFLSQDGEGDSCSCFCFEWLEHGIMFHLGRVEKDNG